jgi:hypothetical protein
VISPAADRDERRRRRRRAAAVRWAVRLAAAVIVFGAGVAVGEALHDNPKPGGEPVTHRITLTSP